MPELPDLHVFALNLNKLVPGPDITAATMHETRKNALPVVTFSEACVGSSVLSVAREGKELLFSLSNGQRFCVHLMLRGAAQLLEAKAIPGVKRKIMSLTFDNGRALVFSDPSSMCKVSLNPPIGRAPDAMSDAFDAAYLKKAIKGNTRRTIKDLLTYQGAIRGIGNAYADEILYAAGISPLSTCGAMPAHTAETLVAATKAVLADAIERILTISPDSISGEERGFLKIHRPDLTQTEKGEAIRVSEVGGRKSYYCAEQKVYL